MIYALYAAVVLVLIGCDQLLKAWTVSNLALGESTAFLPGLLQLTRVHNYGAAWSSFSGKTVMLIAVTAVLLVAVAYLLIRRIVRHPLGIAAALVGTRGARSSQSFCITMLSVAVVLLVLSLIVNAANFIAGSRDLDRTLDMICDNQGNIQTDRIPGTPPDGADTGDFTPPAKPEPPRGLFTAETP